MTCLTVSWLQCLAMLHVPLRASLWSSSKEWLPKAGRGARFTCWGRENEIDVVALDNEIDVVALDNDSHDILFCECKWQNRKIGVDVIRRLLDKAPLVKWFNGARKEHYVVVSKAGFTKKAEEFAKDKGVLLFDLKDMERYFDKTSS